MQINHMLTIQQFMSRCTLTGAECNAFATVMNALQADIARAQQPEKMDPALTAAAADAAELAALQAERKS
jgi:hypothetical protein